MRPPPVALGVLFGLVVGCAGGFESLVQTEQKANVRATKPIARERFHLEYPSNWTIDEEDEDYDPDHLFSIDSPGSCHVTVIVFDSAISAKNSVETQVEAFVPKIVKDPVQTPFAGWGAYDGEGVTLAGKILGLQKGSTASSRTRASAKTSRSPSSSSATTRTCPWCDPDSSSSSGPSSSGASRRSGHQTSIRKPFAVRATPTAPASDAPASIFRLVRRIAIVARTIPTSRKLQRSRSEIRPDGGSIP